MEYVAILALVISLFALAASVRLRKSLDGETTITRRRRKFFRIAE